ncbi:hypothetical protein DDIC_09830 [Desulfovibrio desulfuricans]|uniref:Uncharacterized protein n=1 Tax=Desulfovibrio desulfuricans TaxID=876 RepID=A0A4P7UIF9_DESDE|nr:hypothetical protein [Desulfovibrio desulfuricans]QCC86166.1 hypothetical protein DDIC_09830 [Desulfovibrio desulfuricans]
MRDALQPRNYGASQKEAGRRNDAADQLIDRMASYYRFFDGKSIPAGQIIIEQHYTAAIQQGITPSDVIPCCICLRAA